MTSNQLEYAQIIFGALLAIIPLREILINDSQIKWWKRISKLGRIILFIAIVWIGISCYKIYILSVEKTTQSSIDKRGLDSTIRGVKNELLNGVEGALKKQGQRFDTLTKTIIKIDTVNKYADPVMDVLDDSTRFVGNLSKMFFEIDMKCINNSIAYNFHDKLLIFYIKGDTIINLSEEISEDLQSLKAYGNNGLMHRFGFNCPTGHPLNPLYLYYKMLYSNKAKNGVIQPPLRRLYQVEIKDYPKSIYDLNIKRSFDQATGIRLKNALIKNKYW